MYIIIQSGPKGPSDKNSFLYIQAFGAQLLISGGCFVSI